MSTGDARILDSGYRRYTGPRLAPGHAVRSVIVTTLRHILGLRRPARSKILPVLSIAMAYVPAIVFVGVAALFNRFGEAAEEGVDQFIPDYHEYYGFIISAIVLFVAFVAPEALCPDRRSKVLSLYLASPLTRMTYLAAKAAAVAAVVAMVTLGPPLLLLLGLVTQSRGPDGVAGFLEVLAQVVAAGAVLAAVFTGVSIAIASLTDRRALAAAATLLLVLGSEIAAGILEFQLNTSESVRLLSLTQAPFLLVTRIYGEQNIGIEIGVPALVAGNLAWVAGGAAVAIVRYRRLQVTR